MSWLLQILTPLLLILSVVVSLFIVIVVTNVY